MIIEVTDEADRSEKTGGIAQGMSGSPILQDGKLIGAVTHESEKPPSKRLCSVYRLDAGIAVQALTHADISNNILKNSPAWGAIRSGRAPQVVSVPWRNGFIYRRYAIVL